MQDVLIAPVHSIRIIGTMFNCKQTFHNSNLFVYYLLTHVRNDEIVILVPKNVP